MNIKEETLEKKFKHVPKKYQVKHFNAEIIIEFLYRTYMPTDYFLKPKANIDEITKDCFVADSVEDCRVEADDIYQKYLEFREDVDYTADIEKRWTFMVIINALNYSKNNWEFIKKRVGTLQTPTYAPLLKRSKVSAEARSNYPVDRYVSVIDSQVEATSEEIEEASKDDSYDKEEKKPGKLDMNETKDPEDMDGPFKYF